MKKTLLIAATLFAASAVCGFSAEAKENWENNCAKCHGADGKGDTKMGQKLEVRNYTDPAVKATIKDDEAFKAVKEGLKSKDGKQLMKPFTSLSDDEIKALIAYIKSL